MERLTTSEYDQRPGSWSSDGKTVAIRGMSTQIPADDIALLDVALRTRDAVPEFAIQ